MANNEADIQRARYITAWNSTMVDIWRDRIATLGAVDTGRLYNSVVNQPIQADGRFFEATLSFNFMEYGIYVDRGVGREFARGNAGDVDVVQRKGGGKRWRGQREVRPWFSRAYYASFKKLQEFLAENMQAEFAGMVSDAWRL